MRTGKSGNPLGSVLWSDVPDGTPAKEAFEEGQQEYEKVVEERAAAPEKSAEDLRVSFEQSADNAEPAEAPAEEAEPEEEPEEGEGPPSHSAVKADWVDYAVSQGYDQEDAEAMTKQELVETLGE